MPLASSYSTRNKLLLAVTAFVLLLSWFLAFKKTVNAIVLNHHLKKMSAQNNNLSYNPEYVNRRLAQLDRILGRFEADPDDWKDQFWLKISSVADEKGVEVIYRPVNAATTDSTTTELRESIGFRGKFKDLVILLDTLEKTEGIGKIASAGFGKEKASGQSEEAVKIILKTDFKSISR